MQDDEVRADFHMEMSGFVPRRVKEQTIDNPDYWAYVQSEIRDLSNRLLDDGTLQSKFDMNC